MTETVQQTYDPQTHVVMPKRHLWRWGFGIFAVIVLGFLWLGGRVWEDKSGNWYYVPPTLPQVHQANTQANTTPQNGVTYAKGPNGEIVKVQTTVSDPLADTQALAKQALEAGKAAQQEVKSAVKDLGDQLKAQIAELKQPASQQAAPAPAGSQVVPAAPVQSASVQSQQPTPQAAQAAGNDTSGMNAAEVNLFKPQGMHFNAGMGTATNLAKMKRCVAPHHLEVDRASPKCFAAGYNDPNSGIPVRRCPNKCV